MVAVFGLALICLVACKGTSENDNNGKETTVVTEKETKYDVEGKICMTYPSSGIPYTLVIGKDGTVKKIYVGAADAQTQYRIYKAAIDEELMK